MSGNYSGGTEQSDEQEGRENGDKTMQQHNYAECDHCGHSDTVDEFDRRFDGAVCPSCDEYTEIDYDWDW